jgi:hypothetical protein
MREGGSMSTDNSTVNRYEIAAHLSIANEHIENIRQIDDILTFSVNGAKYDCRLTKTGHVKKNSVRRAV